MNEAGNQSAIRAHYDEQGWRLNRNNVGVLLDKTGRPVRYGLANDSEQLNRVYKSGDLIGWRPVLITPDMVGDVIAQFVSIEVKKHGWRFPTPGPVERFGKLTEYGHCLGQRRWADMVRADGGLAGFMIDPTRGFEPC